MKQKEKKPRAIFKFNGGKGALLCSKCQIIIRSGKELTIADWYAMRVEKIMLPQYCNECKKFINGKK